MFSGIVVEYIKIFCLKLFKIRLNINPKFIVLDVCSYADIKLMCNPLIKLFKIGYLNVQVVSKKGF